MRMKSAQKGFTLIELVFVIVILGVLAAFAVPRFVNLTSDARAATTQGALGSVRSASALVHALALARDATGASASVDTNGDGTDDVDLINGYPSDAAGGIDAALENLDGYTFSAGDGANGGGTATITPDGANTPANCQVSYDPPADANNTPTITIDVSDCS